MSGRRRSPGWAHLTIAERCRLVSSVAERLAEHPPQCLSDWGVISVGAGWRVRESQNRRVIRGRTPVLTLTVKRKRAESQLACDGCIPPHWPVHRGRGESRHLIHIPIDVCRANTRVQAHSPRVAPADANNRMGAACVLLKDKSGAQWLLSCHHVLGDSSASARLTPRTRLAITVHGRNGSHRLADQRHFGLLEAGRSDCVDAAVVRIDPADPVAGTDWSRYPHAVESDAGIWQNGARLLTPRGVIALRYVHTLANAAVEYSSGATAGIVRLAVFESVGDAIPQPGDSGSPAISAEGKWIGMHIAGDGRWSYVIPAYVLLSNKVFDKEFHLST